MILLLLATPERVPFAARSRKVSISGRIVAYRPADRYLQTSSFVVNKEAFLLQVKTSKRDAKPSFAKIEYEHAGFSDMTPQIFEKAPLIKLMVRRDSTCDQSHAQFVSTAPTIRGENPGSEMIGGVVFVEKFKDSKLSPKLKLRCYVLQQGDFQIVSSD